MSATRLLLIVLTIGSAAHEAATLGEDRADNAWFAPIPFIAGSNECQGLGISGDGTTALGYCSTPFTRTTFRWTANDGLISFPSSVRDARAASHDGTVIVGTVNTKAMRWTAATGPLSIGAIPSSGSSSAKAVSADGSVIVGSGDSIIVNGYRWTAQSGMSQLPLLPGSSYTAPVAVSADGQMIAGRSLIGNKPYAFRWTPESGIVNLGTISGAPNSDSDALGISGDGLTVVGISTGQPFRWTAATGMVALPLPLFGSGRAYAASYDGSVIVGTKFDAFTPQSAFVWTPTEGVRTLAQILGPIVPAGWNLTTAYGVSSDGLTIVGTGGFGGQTRAFVAHIPEPAPAVLFGVAAVITICRQSQRRR